MTLRWLLALLLFWLAWRLLRARLARLAGPQPRARAYTAPSADDPHRVLGVRPGASAEEIAHAYRERMKEYHPDRVADLGPELRELAHRKTVEIQHAWQALRPGR